MEETVESNSRTARLAAGLFFFVCIPAVSWSQGYVLTKILVPQHAAATAQRLLSHEFLFRTGIVSHLLSVITFAGTALLLYRLFRPVDQHLARMMVMPPFVQVVVVFMLELFNLTALMTLRSEMVTTWNSTQKQELVYFLLRIHRYGIGASQLFWGLWLLPLGLLLDRSKFAPRIPALLAMVGGIGYMAEGCAFMLLQRTDYLLVRQFLKPIYLLGLGSTMLWLLIMGLRNTKASANE